MSALINYEGNAKHDWVAYDWAQTHGESPQSQKYNVYAVVSVLFARIGPTAQQSHLTSAGKYWYSFSACLAREILLDSRVRCCSLLPAMLHIKTQIEIMFN